MSLDLTKVSRTEIDRTRQQANDTAIIETLFNYSPWEFLGRAQIEYKGISFDGIVQQIERKDSVKTYTIAAPSILLSRNECEVAFEEEIAIEDLLHEIAPEFTVHLDEDLDLYSDANSLGKLKEDIIKEIAEYYGMQYYIGDWNIYIMYELPDEIANSTNPDLVQEGDEVLLTDNDIFFEETENVGGSEVFTKVLAKSYLDESNEPYQKEIQIIDDSGYEIVEVLNSDDLSEATTPEQVDAIAEKRAQEIREEMSRRQFTILLTNIKPSMVVNYDGTRYSVLEVKHTINRQSERTEITVCEA